MHCELAYAFLRDKNLNIYLFIYQGNGLHTVGQLIQMDSILPLYLSHLSFTNHIGFMIPKLSMLELKGI